MPSSPVTTANTSTRGPRRGRIAAALAAGIITVVVGSLDTATAETPDNDREVRTEQVRQFGGGAAGGRLTYR